MLRWLRAAFGVPPVAAALLPEPWPVETRVQGLGLGFGFRVLGVGFGFQGLGVWSLV